MSVIQIESVKDTTLYKNLLEQDDPQLNALVNSIPDICEISTDRIKLLPKYLGEYTLHDKTHFIRVTELMSYVLQDQLQELNGLEKILLVLSAFYHDIGMMIDSDELNELENNDNFIVFKDKWKQEHPNYKELKDNLSSTYITAEEKVKCSKKIAQLDSACLTEYLRINHGMRSYDFVKNKFGSDPRFEIQGQNISETLAKLCVSHVQPHSELTTDNEFLLDKQIGTYSVNLNYLAIVLRLADIFDFDGDRTPDVLFKSIHFTSSVSVVEWQKHRGVQGWEISETLLRFTMQYDHPAYEKAGRKFLDWIDYEILGCQKMISNYPGQFSRYKLKIPTQVDRDRIGPKNESYIYHDFEFSLSRDEIVKLLLTENLYQDPSILIRELLQNSLDALRLRKSIYALEDSEWGAGKVHFEHYLDENGREIIECRDNGVGMDEDVILNFLGKIGRSFYRSPQFEAFRLKLKAKNLDFDPCSQFGIGFMSCFMFGDEINIWTRKFYGMGQAYGDPLSVHINGVNGLIVIRKGKKDQEIGTKIQIVNGNSQLFYDDYSDKIKLTSRVEGSALATEFPISAICRIEGIENNYVCSTKIATRTPFLQKQNFPNIRTYKIDLNDIDPNLKGEVSQSFPVDSDNIPTTENEILKIESLPDRSFPSTPKRQNVITIKESGRIAGSFSYHMKDSITVCVDGIRVSGKYGRESNNEDKLEHRLGWSNAVISCEHEVIVDVRGDIKPELTPARTPVKTNLISRLPFGWKYLQKQVSIASAKIWTEVLIEMSLKGRHEEFWKVFCAYDGKSNFISPSILSNHLFLPCKSEGAVNWKPINELTSFKIDDKSLILKDPEKEYDLNFPNSIIELTMGLPNSVDLHWLCYNILIGLSEMIIESNHANVKLKSSFNDKDYSDQFKIYRFGRNITLIEFKESNKIFMCSNQNDQLMNLKHPLIYLFFESQKRRQSTKLESFAATLITNLSDLIEVSNKTKKPINLNVKSRSLRLLSLKYKNLNWSSINAEYHPPYYIHVNGNPPIIIDDSILKSWS